MMRPMRSVQPAAAATLQLPAVGQPPVAAQPLPAVAQSPVVAPPPDAYKMFSTNAKPPPDAIANAITASGSATYDLYEKNDIAKYFNISSGKADFEIV